MEMPCCSSMGKIYSLKPIHYFIAGLLIGTFTAYSYLRRPVLIGIAFAAAIIGPFGPEVPAFGIAGVLGIILISASEWLLHYSAGGRHFWPAIVALSIAFGGACLSTYHICGETSTVWYICIGMLITLPWVRVASAWQISRISESRTTITENITRTAVTRALLNDCKLALQRKFGDIVKLGSDFESVWYDLNDKLKFISNQMPKISTASQHDDTRRALLSARAQIESDNLDSAYNVLIGIVVDLPTNQYSLRFQDSSPTSWAVRNTVSVIHAYRCIVPDEKRRKCRFEPSCSTYCEESFIKHGFVRGLRLSINRALRCVPFGDFGFDPVPDL